MIFHIFAYSVDYLVNNKYVGSAQLSLEEGKGRVCGFRGRETFSLLQDVKLSNKRVIKRKTTVTTEMIALQ